MSLHHSRSLPVINGLGISFDFDEPEPPKHTRPVGTGPNSNQRSNFRLKQQDSFHSTLLPADGFRSNRAGADSGEMERDRSSDSAGSLLSEKRVRIASGSPTVYRVESINKQDPHQSHGLSPLSGFDTGSSSEEETFSPSSLSSLPSSTESEGDNYPHYGITQQPVARQLRHAQSMVNIQQNQPRIPLPQPPRQMYHSPDDSVSSSASPASRLPAFLLERTKQRGLARPQSMMELGSRAAQQSSSYELPSQVSVERRHEEIVEEEEEEDYGTEIYGGVYSPDSIASSAGGMARRKRLDEVETQAESEREKEHSNLAYRIPENYQLPKRLEEKHKAETQTGLNRHATLLTVGANPLKRTQELNRLLQPTTKKSLPSLSTSSPPTSHHPTLSSHSRSTSLASNAVGITPVVLEQAKSSKARVELDLTLQSSLIVEGGKIKGKIELRVRSKKSNEEILWICKPKMRVVGFEELSAPEARHIFYHHAATVETSSEAIVHAYDSESDREGFYKAKAGEHLVPFEMVLPIGKGAKGGWKGKQGVVRYIVIVSIKLKSASGLDRSIAHFYRHVEIYPYLNPAVFLAPALKPLFAEVSKSLFMGGSGKVKLSASMHRGNWVAGQRCYVDVRVENQTSKKIKTLTLTLVRTTTVYRPELGAGSESEPTNRESPQAQITKKKMAESTLEMGKKGNSSVTAKGSWMGVDKEETAEFSHDILIPSEALSIPRGRHLEVSYALKVSVAGSLSADVVAEIPIRVINFISLDPPPGHCADVTPITSPTERAISKSWSIDQLRPKGRSEELRGQPTLHSRVRSQDSFKLEELNGPGLSRMTSLDTLRTCNLSQPSTVERLSTEVRNVFTSLSLENLTLENQRNSIVEKAQERSLQHRMSLECISSAIKSATKRGQHQRTESGLRSEIERQDENGDKWDEGEEFVPEQERNYYGGGGERSYTSEQSGAYDGVQLDDFEGEEYQRSERNIGNESEDELDAVMNQTSFSREREEEELIPEMDNLLSVQKQPSPIRVINSHPSSLSPVSPRRSSTSPSRLLSSPSKSSIRPRVTSASKSGFIMATPSSPIKSNVALPTLVPSIRRKVSRIDLAPSSPARVLPTRPSTAKPLIMKKSALRNAPVLEKKKSLRSTSSMIDLRNSPHSAGSNATTPELSDHYSRPTTSFSRRTNAVPVTLPNLKIKLANVQERQDALARLRSTDGTKSPSLRRAGSMASMASSYGDLSRADSLMSFKAPLFRS